MNQELQQVLRRAMNKAAFECLKSCSHSQADIDRVANIKDDELLYIVAGMGRDYKIIVRDIGYTIVTLREIPLDPILTKTAHLGWLAKAMRDASKIAEDSVFSAAQHLARELDIRMASGASRQWSIVIESLQGACDAELVELIDEMLTDYTKEYL
jgi:hypothetical protein